MKHDAQNANNKKMILQYYAHAKSLCIVVEDCIKGRGVPALRGVELFELRGLDTLIDKAMPVLPITFCGAPLTLLCGCDFDLLTVLLLISLLPLSFSLPIAFGSNGSGLLGTLGNALAYVSPSVKLPFTFPFSIRFGLGLPAFDLSAEGRFFDVTSTACTAVLKGLLCGEAMWSKRPRNGF